MTNKQSAIVRDFLDVLGKTGNTAAKIQNTNHVSDYSQILGSMIKNFTAAMPMADLNQGSVLTALLETVAQQQFQHQQSVIKQIQDLADAIKDKK